ncbi:hypothetical protein ACFC1T_17055 [Kitasatospora sp. NPDC056076]|uniref:hypothetical protein n=1 Tax=Kitasatospora sp. NPDC056076 TaxID=3345703 RepID=UPI0035DAAF0F
MTSAYQQQLAQQLRDAETELAQWRRQGRRAERYRAAWLSARERAQAYGEGILRLCNDRDQALAWLRTAEAERFEAGQLSHQYRTRAEQAEARIAAVRELADQMARFPGYGGHYDATMTAVTGIRKAIHDFDEADSTPPAEPTVTVGYMTAVTPCAAGCGQPYHSGGDCGDAAYMGAIAAAMNEAVADFCSPSPARFTGLDQLINRCCPPPEAQP